MIQPIRTQVNFILKTLAILPLLAAFLVLAAACSSDGPTNSAIPQSADEIKKAGQELIDAWYEATQKRDAPAVHSLLRREIADLCTVEQIEVFLTRGVGQTESPPDFVVKQVFLDPDDAKEAIMVLEIGIDPVPRNDNTEANTASIAYPISLEGDRWHMAFSFPFVDLGDGCPFVYGFSSQEPIQVTPTPSGR